MNKQQDQKKIASSLTYVEAKLFELKRTIENFLHMLEEQGKVPWPDMLNKYTSIVRELSQLQDMLRRSAVPAGLDDDAQFFKSHLVVPQVVSLEYDSALHISTEGRVPAWTHEIVPEALRTKLPIHLPNVPEVADAEMSTYEFEQMIKETQGLNKEMESIMEELEDVIKDTCEQKLTLKEKEAARKAPPVAETVNLVLAMMAGKGIRAADLLPKSK